MISLFVRADKLRLASLFVSKEETRYYLMGVHVQSAGNDGVRLAATDGHRAALFHDDGGFTTCPAIVMVPADAARAIKTCKERQFCWFGIVGEHDGKGRHEARIFNTDQNAASLDEAQERMHDITDRGVIWAGAVDLIDGIFPDVASVVPTQVAPASIGGTFQSVLLKDFGEVAAEHAAAKSGPIRIYPNGKNAAVVTCGRPDFVGVIMPMSDATTSLVEHGPVFHPPAWIGTPATAAASPA